MWTSRSTSLQHSRAAWTGGLTMVLHLYCCVKSHFFTVLFIDRLPLYQSFSSTSHLITYVSRRSDLLTEIFFVGRPFSYLHIYYSRHVVLNAPCSHSCLRASRRPIQPTPSSRVGGRSYYSLLQHSQIRSPPTARSRCYRHHCRHRSWCRRTDRDPHRLKSNHYRRTRRRVWKRRKFHSRLIRSSHLPNRRRLPHCLRRRQRPLIVVLLNLLPNNPQHRPRRQKSPASRLPSHHRNHRSLWRRHIDPRWRYRTRWLRRHRSLPR